MERFCYKCGATETEKGPLIEGLCPGCFAVENPLLRVPAEIHLKVCGRCGSYLLEHEWREVSGDSEEPLLNAAEEAVLSRLKVAKITPMGVDYVGPDEAREIKIEVEPRFVRPDILVEVFAQGKFQESQAEPLSQRARVKAKIERTTCDICSRISSGYYEAILQVRGEGELSKEKIANVRRTLEEGVFAAHERDRSVFVAKVEQKHGGLDFYLSSLALARQMARLLKSEFGAEVQESAKLVGRDKSGRRKFRVSVLSRLPESR